MKPSLFNCSLYVLMAAMERIDRARLADILLNAPAWARVGLTVRDARMRERAADALAATIVERLTMPMAVDHDPLPLPVGGGGATNTEETGPSI